MKTIYIKDGETSFSISTTENQYPKILAEANVAFRQEDNIIFDLEKTQGKITIDRSFPIKITVDGSTTHKYVVNGNVKDTINKTGISLNKLDILSMPLDATVKENDHIEITRVKINTKEEFSDIPFDTITKNNSKLMLGTISSEQKGRKGKLSKTY